MQQLFCIRQTFCLLDTLIQFFKKKQVMANPYLILLLWEEVQKKRPSKSVTSGKRYSFLERTMHHFSLQIENGAMYDTTPTPKDLLSCDKLQDEP